jgi:hypothetical protein
MLPWQRRDTIYCFWTGSTPMSETRKACLTNLREVSGCRVVLVTQDTMPYYIVAPLHPAYPYLSEVHKSDYLRCYFMHFHGGGYADIKLTMGSWRKAFRDMELNPSAYINGYRAGGPDNVSAAELKPEWMSLIGPCQFIVRPRTEFTHEWYRQVCIVLDGHLDELRKHPAAGPYDCAPGPSGYPIGYTDLMGIPFNRVQYVYRDRTMFTVPNHYLSHYR